MVEEMDWRLQISGKCAYLRNLKLYWKKYTPYSETWTHDHCALCFATFAEYDGPDILHHGYTTEDEYRWICKKCFEDFKDHFGWQAVEE